MIHDSVDSDAAKDVRIVGSATFTMVVSSRAMNMPINKTANACQLRRGMASSAGRSRAVVVSVMSYSLSSKRSR